MKIIRVGEVRSASQLVEGCLCISVRLVETNSYSYDYVSYTDILFMLEVDSGDFGLQRTWNIINWKQICAWQVSRGLYLPCWSYYMPSFCGYSYKESIIPQAI